VAFVPLAFVRREWRGRSALLLGLTAFAVFAWLLWTHRIPRFLVPYLVPLGLVSAAGAAAFELRRASGAVVGLVLVALAVVEFHATFRVRAPADEARMLAGRFGVHEVLKQLEGGTTYSHRAILFVNDLPPESKALFYGEARTLYCTADVVAPTVFDENPLDGIIREAATAENIRDGLGARGITHLYVNRAELERLQWSYAFQYAGRTWHGYSLLEPETAAAQRFERFLARHTAVVFFELPGPGWKRFVDRELVRTMSRHEKDPKPRVPQMLLRQIPLGLPPHLLDELLPELPPEQRRRPPADKLPILVARLLHRLRFCVYRIRPAAPLARLDSSTPGG
jgi:hypothetical protein